MVEELENKKISLDNLCTAHREENIRINAALNKFLEEHHEIYDWLITIADAFLQKHKFMGNNLDEAKEFLDLHSQLLCDLQVNYKFNIYQFPIIIGIDAFQTKGNEINVLLGSLPSILEYLEDNQRRDVDNKVEELHNKWMNLKNVLENRLDLSKIYIKFHTEADIVNNEMNSLESSLQQNKDRIDEQFMKNLEDKFESLSPLYQSAKNTGITFINSAHKVRVRYFTFLIFLSTKNYTRSWQNFNAHLFIL